MTLHIAINLILILTVCSGAIVAWKFAKNVDDNYKPNNGNRVSIKIDRNGKYHYDHTPESGNTNLLFWMRLVIVIVSITLIAFPLQSLLDRS